MYKITVTRDGKVEVYEGVEFSSAAMAALWCEACGMPGLDWIPVW